MTIITGAAVMNCAQTTLFGLICFKFVLKTGSDRHW